MSSIATYLNQILRSVYGKDVRQAIHDAISQCYNDVNAPALQTEAMEAAVQAKIDAGEMAELTIADGSLTGAKLADGTITAGKIATGVIPAVDATLTTEGAAADAAAVGAAIAAGGSGTSFYVDNPNNSLDWSAEGVLTGKVWYNNNNADTINGDASISDFMSVESGDTICLNLVARLKWFNENKTFLSTETGGTYKLVTAPEGAAYFRVQVATGNLETAWLYKYYGTYYAFSAFADHMTTPEITDAHAVVAIAKGVNAGLKDKSVDMSNAQDDVLSYEAIDQLTLWRWNVVDPDKILRGWRINATTGEISYSGTSGTTGSALSDLCKVQPGEVYRGFNGSLYGYDANKAFLGPITQTATYTWTIPDGVYYVRLANTVNWSTFQRFYFIKDGYGQTFAYNGNYPYERAFPMFASEDEKTGFKLYLDLEPWAGKKILTIGDSFSAPGHWQNAMCTNFHAVSVDKSVSGAGWTTGRTKTVYQLAQEVSTDPDIIIIVMGTNDVNATSTEAGEYVNGTTVEDYSTDTWWGGMQKALTYIRNRWTGVPVYVGFTPGGGLNEGRWQRTSDFVEIMKEVCLRYSCVYIETRTCGMGYPLVQGDLIFRNSAGDGHPSYAGQMQIGRYMTDLMSGYMHARSWDLPTVEAGGET